MSLQLAPVNVANNDTFLVLITAANNLINALATEVVTVNTAANGGLTIGNGYVSGIFGATTLVATNLQGGSVQTPAAVLLQSNLVANSSLLIQVGNTTINNSTVNASVLIANAAAITYLTLEAIQMGNTEIEDLSTTTTGTSAQIIDYFSLTSFRSSEYFISMKDNNANNYGTTKLSVIQNGANAYITEYGQLYTNNAMGTFSANANSSAAIIWFTPVSTNTTVRATRTSLRV